MLECIANTTDAELLYSYFFNIAEIAKANTYESQPIIDFIQGEGAKIYKELDPVLQCLKTDEGFLILETALGFNIFESDFSQ